MSAVNALSALLGFAIGFGGTMWGLSAGWSYARAMTASVGAAIAVLVLVQAVTT